MKHFLTILLAVMLILMSTASNAASIEYDVLRDTSFTCTPTLTDFDECVAIAKFTIKGQNMRGEQVTHEIPMQEKFMFNFKTGEKKPVESK